MIFYPWYDGGAEWGGSAFDPADKRLILNAQDVAGILKLTEIPVGFSPAGALRPALRQLHGLELEGTDAA